MEAIRPEVDAWLFRFLKIRTLRRQSFVELRSGQCRLMPDLAKELAQTSVHCAQKLGPVVEGLAQTLYQHESTRERSRPWALSRSRPGTSKPLPTPITQTRRRARFVEWNGQQVEMDQTAVHVSSESDVGGGASRTMLEASPAPVAMPAPQLTKDGFLRHVMPALRDIPAVKIAKAVGLSEPYCAKIRAGRGLPHRKHWDAFARLAAAVGAARPDPTRAQNLV